MAGATQTWWELPRYREMALGEMSGRRFGGYLALLAALSAAFLLPDMSAYFGISFAAFIEIAGAHVALTTLKALAGPQRRGLPFLNALFWAWAAGRPDAASLGWFLYLIVACNDGLYATPSLWMAALLGVLPLMTARDTLASNTLLTA